MQDKQTGGWSHARQAIRGLVSCKTSSQVAGLGRDEKSGAWSRPNTNTVRGLVSCKTRSQGAGAVQDNQSGGWSRARQTVRCRYRARQAVRGLVSCKTSSQGAGIVQDKLSGAGIVQDKQSEGWSHARQAVRQR